MQVNMADSFFESLKKLRHRERFYYKILDFFKYDLPGFIKNVWIFRKMLWNHRWWDWRFTMEAMYTSISEMEKGMHDGLEVRISRDKKIKKMQRSLYLMKCFIDDNFINLAEAELGKIIHIKWEFEKCEDLPGFSRLINNESDEVKEHNKKVYNRARELEEQMWNELWEIFKGQDYSKFKKKPEGMNHNKNYDYWDAQFDGSGMRGWGD